MTRVLLADDQAMVREGFAAVLSAQPDLEVVGGAADGEEAVALSRQHLPDVVLMDIRMPRLDGLAATRRLLAASPASGAAQQPEVGHRLKVVVLTTFDLDEYVYQALRAGASGFLLKDATAGELVSAVRVVAAGDALLAPSVTRRLIQDFARRGAPSPAQSAALASLTPREQEVLRLVACGLTNREVAAELVVAEQTVKTHLGRIFHKLELRDRAQAVVFSYESGLVTPGHRPPG